MTRLVVTGAGGRMGRTVIETAHDRPETTVVGAVNRSPVGDTSEPASDTSEPAGDASGRATSDDTLATDDALDSYGEVMGVSVTPAAAFDRLLRAREPTAVVDFTAPAATAEYAERTAEYTERTAEYADRTDDRVAFVTGTTGLDESARTALDQAADAVPVLHASNFSRGIATLQRAVRTAAAALAGYDVEVTETHHDGKRDAPSGTAETLIEAVTDARPDLTDRQHGRVGEAPRESAAIGVHARRAGDVTGEHEVLFAGDDQTVRLTHRAGSRQVFADGALDAADWLAGRAPGRYSFDDVLDGTPASDDGATATNPDAPTEREESR